MSVFIKTLVVTLAISGLAGCTFTRLAHNYADWIFLSRLDDAFDLNKTQKADIKKRMPLYLDFLDTRLIPEVIEVLRTAVKKARGGFQMADLVWMNEQYERLRTEVLIFIAADAGELLMSLNEAQLKHFRRYLDEKNEDIEERLELSAEKLAEEEQERRIDYLEKWYGDFNAGQKKTIKALNQDPRAKLEARLAARKIFQQAVYNLAETKPGADAIAARIRAWSEHSTSMLDDAEMRRRYNESRSQFLANMVEVSKIATPKQHRHLENKVTKIIADLSVLAREPKENPKVEIKAG